MAGAKGRSGLKTGGAKPGAGRPRKHPVQLPLPPQPRGAGAPTPPAAEPKREIEWALVTNYAKNGVSEKDIRLALDITDDLLDNAAADRLAKIIKRGHAQHRVDLQVRINERGKETKEGDGSVNILKAQAQEHLGWNREIPTQEVEPDLGTIRSHLETMLLQLARQQSMVEGRYVSVLEILKREADIGTKPEPKK